MGYYFDIFSIFHFIGGFLTTLVIYPDDRRVALILANCIHFITECSELSECSHNGNVSKIMDDHISDILLFLIGSIIAVFAWDKIYEKFENNEELRHFAISITAIGWLLEVGLELVKYSKTTILK